jgi:SnoaL-like domain
MRWLYIVLFVMTAAAQDRSQQVGAVLDAWHHAAAAADESSYFSYFAARGVFMGTDATERWTVPQFQAWAKPHFAKHKAWNFTPKDRHIDFSADGQTAWFDEMLDTPNLGLCRGSGVLVRESGAWKIAQYNLSIPIPNELADGIVREIGSGVKKR